MHTLDEGDRLHMMGGAVVIEIVQARHGRASVRVKQPEEMDVYHEKLPKPRLTDQSEDG